MQMGSEKSTRWRATASACGLDPAAPPGDGIGQPALQIETRPKADLITEDAE